MSNNKVSKKPKNSLRGDFIRSSNSRPIRSYVKREGKITSGQLAAIERFWPHYGVEFDVQELDLAALFQRDAYLVMEIGFGNGISLADMATENPGQNFFGVEVHRPGVGSLLVQIGQRELRNVRVSKTDAIDVLRLQFPDDSLDRLQIFFPDPWHKKRHHKRRLINPTFINLALKKLKHGAVLHVATDWENYAEQILTLFEIERGLSNTASSYAIKPAYRPLTKYEERGKRLGHGVWDIIFFKA